MRKIRLGKTGLEVSAISFGTWSFGGDWGDFDVDQAKATVHRALDLGINFFDTAQAYGFGAAEKLLGEALWERVGRDEVIVATKGGLRMEGDTLLRDASAGWLRAGVESSLRNLRTDTIDLYQVHWPDGGTAAEETAGVLEEMVREGKIRHVGVSNYSAEQMAELARHGRVETLQPPYSMLRRDVEEEVLPYTAENDIGVLVYGALAHGVLSGKMTAQTTFEEDDWRSGSPDFEGDAFRTNLQVVSRLEDFAAGRGITMPQLAIAWTLSHPAVHVAIVGARTPAHLEESAHAAEVELSRGDRRELERIIGDAVTQTGPSPEAV